MELLKPPSFTTTPTDILRDTQAVINRAHSVKDSLAQIITPAAATFENVICPLVHEENLRYAAYGILSWYKSASADASLRQASLEATKLLHDLRNELLSREHIFSLVSSVKNNSTNHLDGEDQHLLNVMYKEFVKSGGFSLPAGSAERNRFQEIQEEITGLTTQFSTNLFQFETVNDHVLFSKAELAGLPERNLEHMQPNVNNTYVGERYAATFSRDMRPIMRFASNPETRKRMYIAHKNRVNVNVPIFKRVVVLRDESARLLGYNSHAELVLEDKMAGSTENVYSFLEDLKSKLLPAAEQEMKRYRDAKRRDIEEKGEEWDGRLYSWDQAFYGRIMTEYGDGVDHDKVAEYFPLEPTLKKVMQIYEEFFGLEFKAIDTTGDNKGLVWHEGVLFFSVRNSKSEGGQFQGYLYLDIYVRPYKEGGGYRHSICPNQDKSRTTPATALVFDFPPPSENKPHLLRHSELVLLFHELGHAIHDVVSITKYARFHGSSGTCVDFGEAPSQMFENWCHEPSMLKRISQHYSFISPGLWEIENPDQKLPERQIPGEIIAKLLDGRSKTRAYSYLKHLNISELYNRLGRELDPGVDGPYSLGHGDEWGHAYTNIRSFMDGDYHAGYYGYLLSEVCSADIFDTFFKNDLTGKQEGMRYRRELLQPGGSRPEMETLVRYLGRESKLETFYRKLGLD
ncbi:metallopeptidase [Podospora australis]|uniref:Metallopeptidase n=1 Tax=Podospora australis TaxID=1536484 RepID=A0AAN7AFS3_9PEZI|nr:metallopeptidase [Podospora australis]